MQNQSKIPKIVKHEGEYWIRPFSPHWDMWIGPYSTPSEAKEDKEGMEITINGAEWQMMLVEMEDEFDEAWEKAKLLIFQ